LNEYLYSYQNALNCVWMLDVYREYYCL
jgi:hypothetical protein